jgi:hypothetical protein
MLALTITEVDGRATRGICGRPVGTLHTVVGSSGIDLNVFSAEFALGTAYHLVHTDGVETRRGHCSKKQTSS